LLFDSTKGIRPKFSNFNLRFQTIEPKMNVHPALLNHPKYLLFRQEVAGLGFDCALEYLVRLWAHCQTMGRGENWGNVDNAYVEVICNWNGQTGKLAEALSKTFYGKPGWIHHNQTGELIISSWNEHNQSLINSWNSGRKGGRPPATPLKPTENPQVNPPATPLKPTENPIGVELIGVDRSGVGGPPVSLKIPDAVIPTVSEVVEFGKMGAGIPEDYCIRYFEKKEIATGSWLSRGALIDWKREVTGRWKEDRATWSKNKKRDGATPNKSALDDVIAELQWQKKPERVAHLRKLKKELEGKTA
jgi:hypothetical protein